MCLSYEDEIKKKDELENKFVLAKKVHHTYCSLSQTGHINLLLCWI